MVFKNLKKIQMVKRIYSTQNFYIFKNTFFGKKIISYFIKKGKIQKAEKLVSLIFFFLSRNKIIRKYNLNYVKVFKIALINIMPFFETKSLKRKGSKFLITLPLYNKNRRLFLLFKFLKTFSKNSLKKKNHLSEYLASEIVQIYLKKGYLFNKFQDQLTQLYNNQPYLHYRWK